MLKAYFIDVRKFDDERFLNEALSSASLFRREKYEEYKYDKAKKQSIAVAYLLDKYLSTIGLREKDVVYEFSKYGKPSIKGHDDIHFCLSHSDNFAMAVCGDELVGCDIQKVTKIDEKLIDMVLSSSEKEELMLADACDKMDKFFKYWVMKEAIIKRGGQSIASILKNVHSDSVYIDDIELPDLAEKYYFAVYSGENKVPKIDKFVL